MQGTRGTGPHGASTHWFCLKVLVIKARVGLAPIYTIPTAQSRCSGFTCDIPVVSVFCHCGYVTFRLNRFYNLLHVQLRWFMGTFFSTFRVYPLPPKKPQNKTKQNNPKNQPNNNNKPPKQQQTKRAVGQYHFLHALLLRLVMRFTLID